MTRCPVSAARMASLDGLQVAHLPDQNHVRVLTQHVLQGIREAPRVPAQLALGDHREAGRVGELDGILHRHDVGRDVLVNVVDHGGLGGGLPTPGRAGDQDEATRPLREVAAHIREAQVLDGLDLQRDHPEDRADQAAVGRHIHAEAGEVRDEISEVELPRLLEGVPLLRGEDVVGEPLRLVRRERRVVGRDQLAVNPKERGAVRFDVNVGSVPRHRRAQQVVQTDLVRHSLPP